MPDGNPQVNLIQYNAMARQRCVNEGLRMVQQIGGFTFDPTATAVINLPPRYAGLILGFIVEVAGTVTLTDTTNDATRTELGGSNLIQNFTLIDLNNQQRINTTGWHVALMNSARQGFVFGGAYAPNVGENFGNNWVVQTTPATITHSTGDVDAAVSQLYYIPCAYSNTDLRGAIYAAVNNATMQLSITPTPNSSLFAASGDATNSVYSGATGTWKTGASLTINVYQVYLDQLPRDQRGLPILPVLDLNNIYEYKNIVTNTTISANSDFPIQYANYRQFLSTTAVFDNGGTLNTGSDVNYWSIQSANFTNIIKISPKIAALMQRQVFMADPPKGVYYFDHRSAPINTANYGNMELVLNASSVNSGAKLLIGYEDFAQVNQLVGAGSLPG